MTRNNPTSSQNEIIHLDFAHPHLSQPPEQRTLQSLVKVQGTLGLYQDGLYLLTHYGDRDALFQKANQLAMDNPMIEQTWRFCSIFASATGNSVIMGRNWDNQNVGSIIVSLYHPPGGYAAISFSRAIDLGFPLNMDLEAIKSSPLGDRLLLAPFHAFDGINEHGLAVAVAGTAQTAVGAKGDRELVFVTFLVRKMLDLARNTPEAVRLAEQYVPFDLDKNALNTHVFVVDVAGRSAILEYDHHQCQVTFGDRAWQVLTNKRIYQVPDTRLRDTCWRYQSMSETLERAEGTVDWQAGMAILRDAAQKGTTWSAVYAPLTKELYVSVYQQWGTIYHLELS